MKNSKKKMFSKYYTFKVSVIQNELRIWKALSKITSIKDAFCIKILALILVHLVFQNRKTYDVK
jgi:hypothetical protein